MSILEQNLKKRVEALFQNEIKKRLSETAGNIFFSVMPKQKNNALENLQEKLKAMQVTLGKLTDELLNVGNTALDDFGREISSVQEPEKSQAVERLNDLITAEIKKIVKSKTMQKFREE